MPGKKRLPRLILAHFRMQALRVPLRHVGRIRNDHAVFRTVLVAARIFAPLQCRLSHGCREISLKKANAIFEIMSMCIGVRDLERFGRDIDSRNARERQLVRERDRNRSRAGPHVQQSDVPRRAPGSYFRKAPLRPAARFRARGISTAGVTESVSPKNSCVPIMYCMGSKARRRRTSSW